MKKFSRGSLQSKADGGENNHTITDGLINIHGNDEPQSARGQMAVLNQKKPGSFN